MKSHTEKPLKIGEQAIRHDGAIITRVPHDFKTPRANRIPRKLTEFGCGVKTGKHRNQGTST
jgi:hypothetical protein